MRRRAQGIAVLAAFAIAPVSACEFDGLGHGDGPAAAIFAGAQPYQALNGLIDGIGDGTGIVALELPPAEKPAPRRSFAGWAKASEAAGSPAAGSGGAASPSAGAAGPAPQHTEAQQGEQRQAPPRGGPVP